MGRVQAVPLDPDTPCLGFPRLIPEACLLLCMKGTQFPRLRLWPCSHAAGQSAASTQAEVVAVTAWPCAQTSFHSLDEGIC